MSVKKITPKQLEDLKKERVKKVDSGKIVKK
jgi:hypothetical protein